MPGDLLVGTTKGLFVLNGGDGWRVTGPFCDGLPINPAIGDAATDCSQAPDPRSFMKAATLG